MREPCLECGEREYTLDDRLGAFVCNACGLVAESVILEETTYSFNKAGETVHSPDKGQLGSAPISGKKEELVLVLIEQIGFMVVSIGNNL